MYVHTCKPSMALNGEILNVDSPVDAFKDRINFSYKQLVNPKGNLYNN